jgi:hypothetical protein
LICAGCNPKSQEEVEQIKKLGLIGGHAYSVSRIEKIEDKNKNEVILLNLRNPWGKFEW